MPSCSACGREFPKLEKCEYCGKLFCNDDYPTHMGFERRHQGMAEDESKLWRRRREVQE